MFRYSFIVDTLLKAMTHKYVRRIPKGVTKTGATKYVYFYAGQEGHGKGIGHEDELTAGASFAFGEHGKNRYHMHIVLEAGNKITLRYDDGDKKGQTVTMTKNEFKDLLHKEHASNIQGAKEKANKQLKDFQAGKDKGVKVKQSTLDKLEQRVKNLDKLAPTKEDNVKSLFTKFKANPPTTFDGFQDALDGIRTTARTLDTVQKTIQFLKTYQENMQDILGILHNVITDQDLYKRFGMLETLIGDRDALISRIEKDTYDEIRLNIPLIEREHLAITGFKKDVKDRIASDISLIENVKEDVSPEFMGNLNNFHAQILSEQAKKEKNPFVSQEMQSAIDFVKHPRVTKHSSSDMRLVPSVIYREQADNVIDFYLSHNMGEKFAGIPNIREILKDQINRRVNTAGIINVNNIDDIRKYLSNRTYEPITFENMPILQTSESLNNLFDAPTLDKLRNKLDTRNKD